MLNNKSNQICIMKILKEYSDEEHILHMKDIISKMNNIYGIGIDRRTVYSAIEALNLLGYDISVFKENGKGYYLRTREFELSEIRLLMDRIYSLNYISKQQTDDLLDKIQGTLSIYQRKKFKNLKIVRENKKTKNKEIFLNIELLDEAISKGVKVEFDYMEYNLDKKLVPKYNMRYVINPYRMVCANERYYLVCNYDKYDNMSHYRIDLIKNIKVLNVPVKSLSAGFDLTAYSNNLLYMFGGTNESIEIICDNFMVTEVMDRFGADVRLSKVDDEHFRLSINMPPWSIKFWALQYLEYCTVIKPEWLVDDIVNTINKNRYDVKKSMIK